MFDLGEYVGLVAVVAVMIAVLVAYCIVGKHENGKKHDKKSEQAENIAEANNEFTPNMAAAVDMAGFWGKSKTKKGQLEDEYEENLDLLANNATDMDDLSKRIVESIEEQTRRTVPEPKFQATFKPEDNNPQADVEETMVLGAVAATDSQENFDDEKTLFISKEEIAPALGAVAMGDGGEDAEIKPMEESHVLMPEKPLAFGYKMAWLAIPSAKSASVLSSLGLKDIKPANWTQGLTAAYEDKKSLFVTPVLNGWVLVIGRALWAKADLNRPIKEVEWFRDLSEIFDDYCYFSTMRGLENHGWVKVEKGALVRAYGVSGELEEVVWCFGNPTKEELAINPNFPSPAEVGESPVIIDEKNVLQMAALWSVDTTFTNRQYGPDLGFVGKI